MNRFFDTVHEAMNARGVSEFVVGLHFRTTSSYMVTDNLEPLMRIDILSSPSVVKHVSFPGRLDRDTRRVK